MSRNWMVAAGVAAILALVIGVALGRSVIPSASESAPKAPDPVHFVDASSGIALTYPGTWHRLSSTDAQVRLLASDGSTRSLSLRVSASELENVTRRSLPVARQFTDSLLSADQRARMLAEPQAVTLGGMLGYRYRYAFSTSDGVDGAHVHYFLFRPKELIQLVFQVQPATSLTAAEPEFERIAASLRRTTR